MMRFLRYGGLAIAASCVCLLLWLTNSPSQAQQPTLEVHTTPPLAQVVPDDTLTTVRLQAATAAGDPIKNANYLIKLTAPVPQFWTTSDFPLVEGTELLTVEGTTQNGVMEFQQQFPIRGQYQLQVRVTPLGEEGIAAFSQTIPVIVPENPVKYRNTAILIVLLVGIGLLGGWIIGGEQTIPEGEWVPRSVRLLLSGLTGVAIVALLWVNIRAEIVYATVPDLMPLNETSVATQLDSTELQLMGDSAAIVGLPSRRSLQLLDATTGAPLENYPVNITVKALESGDTVLAFAGQTNEQGSLPWREQFFDGAPHEVAASTTLTNGKTIRATHEIEVQGIQPPLRRRFITLSYYMGIFLTSILVGFGGHRRQSRRSLTST